METVTVKELIGMLKRLEQDALVLLSRDEEGNGFGTISKDGFYEKFKRQDDLGELPSVYVIYPFDEFCDLEEMDVTFEED